MWINSSDNWVAIIALAMLAAALFLDHIRFRRKMRGLNKRLSRSFKRKPRVVLGVGYPCFLEDPKGDFGGGYTSLCLKNQRDLLGSRVRFRGSLHKIGGWRKVRLVAEPL